jgi:hypothetical protein
MILKKKKVYQKKSRNNIITPENTTPQCMSRFACRYAFFLFPHHFFMSLEPSSYLSGLVSKRHYSQYIYSLHERMLIANLQAKVKLRRHNAESVGVAETTPPALDTDDGVALLEYTKLEGVADTPLEALVDILLPRDLLEVGLLLVVVEGVDAAVQVRVARGDGVAGDHDNGADGAVLGDKAGGVATKCLC